MAAIGWTWFAFIILSGVFAGRLWATIIAELFKRQAGRMFANPQYRELRGGRPKPSGGSKFGSF